MVPGIDPVFHLAQKDGCLRLRIRVNCLAMSSFPVPAFALDQHVDASGRRPVPPGSKILSMDSDCHDVLKVIGSFSARLSCSFSSCTRGGPPRRARQPKAFHCPGLLIKLVGALLHGRTAVVQRPVSGIMITDSRSRALEFARISRPLRRQPI